MKIDTSTTEGEMAVMQAHVDGRKIECTLPTGWLTVNNPQWNWIEFDYRISEEPEQAGFEEVILDVKMIRGVPYVEAFQYHVLSAGLSVFYNNKTYQQASFIYELSQGGSTEESRAILWSHIDGRGFSTGRGEMFTIPLHPKQVRCVRWL